MADTTPKVGDAVRHLPVLDCKCCGRGIDPTRTCMAVWGRDTYLPEFICVQCWEWAMVPIKREAA